MNDAPDLRFEVMQIKVRSDGTSSCHATYKYSGTGFMQIDPTRLVNTLQHCKENENGILSFPYPTRTPIDSTESSLLNNTPKFSTLDGFDDDFLEIVQELSMKWKDIASSSSTSNQNKMFEFLITKLLLRRFIKLHNISKEESDYLIEVNDNKIMLNTIPKPTETLQLAYPFHFAGDFFFHLDDESKIIMSEMRAYLVAEDT